LSWVYICKILCDPGRPGAYRKHEVFALSWRFIVDVVLCDRDEERRPIVPKKTGPKVSNEDAMRKMWWKHGFPLHVIEEKLKAWVLRMQGRKLRKGRAANPKRRAPKVRLAHGRHKKNG
jgi:hypothetical protein